ncbi:MAG: cytochrome c [Caulobacteraceae bacterium]
MTLFRLALLTTVEIWGAFCGAGCHRVKGLPAPNTPAPPPSADTAAAAFDSVPLGNPPGAPIPGIEVRNPLAGPAAVEGGKTLFGAMNCVYCHNANGAGLIGPGLQGPGWRYGGTPIQIYASIRDGRPKGMPAFGAKLPPDEIWKLVAYVESLGGASPPATDASPPNAPSVTGPQASRQQPGDTARREQAAADAAKP